MEREAVDPHKKLRNPKYKPTDHSINAVADRSECCLVNFQMPHREFKPDPPPETVKAHSAKTKYSKLDEEGLRVEFARIKELDVETLDAEIPILQTERARRSVLGDVERDYLEQLRRCLAMIQERLDEQKQSISLEWKSFKQKHGAKKAFELLREKHTFEDKKSKSKSKSSDVGWWDSIVRAVKSSSLGMEISFETKFGARITFSREDLEPKLVISYRDGSAGKRFEHCKVLIAKEIEEVEPKMNELDRAMQMIGIFLHEITPPVPPPTDS